jgi:hypothetical protein
MPDKNTGQEKETNSDETVRYTPEELKEIQEKIKKLQKENTDKA